VLKFRVIPYFYPSHIDGQNVLSQMHMGLPKKARWPRNSYLIQYTFKKYETIVILFQLLIIIFKIDSHLVQIGHIDISTLFKDFHLNWKHFYIQ